MKLLPSCAKANLGQHLERMLKAIKAIVKVCSIFPFYFLFIPFYSLTLVIVWTWLSIALVPQEPVLFEMTIRENIMWGTNRDIVSLEEIIEAATTANNQQVHLVAPE